MLYLCICKDLQLCIFLFLECFFSSFQSEYSPLKKSLTSKESNLLSVKKPLVCRTHSLPNDSYMLRTEHVCAECQAKRNLSCQKSGTIQRHCTRCTNSYDIHSYGALGERAQPCLIPYCLLQCGENLRRTTHYKGNALLANKEVRN